MSLDDTGELGLLAQASKYILHIGGLCKWDDLTDDTAIALARITPYSSRGGPQFP